MIKRTCYNCVWFIPRKLANPQLFEGLEHKDRVLGYCAYWKKSLYKIHVEDCDKHQFAMVEVKQKDLFGRVVYTEKRIIPK